MARRAEFEISVACQIVCHILSKRGMVRKNVGWRDSDPPSTPSQIRTYIDSCKDFLLSTEAENIEQEFKKQEFPCAVPSKMIDNIGVIKAHADFRNSFECFICRAVTLVGEGNIVNANPFTRSYCMLLCNSCHGSALSSSNI